MERFILHWINLHNTMVSWVREFILSLEEILLSALSIREVFHLALGMGELLPPTWTIKKARYRMLSLKELCYPTLEVKVFLHLTLVV